MDEVAKRKRAPRPPRKRGPYSLKANWEKFRHRYDVLVAGYDLTRDMLDDVLTDAGMDDITSVEDCEQAISQATSWKPVLVILLRVLQSPNMGAPRQVI